MLKMASSCKRRPHHHDHGEDHHRQHRYHCIEHHDADDDQQHRCSKNSNSNRFTTSTRYSRRMMMHYPINSSRLTLATALIMFVAVLLMPHHHVFAEETGSEPDFTTDLQVQTATLKPTENSTPVEPTKVELNDLHPQNVNIEINEAQATITVVNEKLNDDSGIQQTTTSVDGVDVVKIPASKDSDNESVSSAYNNHEVSTFINEDIETVAGSTNNVNPNAEDKKLHEAATTKSHNVTQIPTIDEINIQENSTPTIENASSPQAVNNEDSKFPNSKQTEEHEVSYQNVGDDKKSEVTNSQTSQVTDNEKSVSSASEELAIAIPPTVDDFEHTAQQQIEVNNDIFSTIDEVQPEIKTSPDFIDSQPSGVKVSESSENLEQSIRNSVKTEIEMEQNLESSPVLEILKDIAEPEIRQTLKEDLIEPAILSRNDVAHKAEEDEPEDSKNGNKIEIKEEQYAKHADTLLKQASKDAATLDGSNWVYLRGARNLAIETANASSSSSSISSSSSSESRSQEKNTEEGENNKEDNNRQQEIPEESNEKDIKEQKQENESESGNDNDRDYDPDDNEDQNNAQEDLDIEESKADLTIAETSEELHAAVTTPTSDIAILDESEEENVSAEANDDALSVVLEESLSPAQSSNEDADEFGVIVDQKGQKTSLDQTDDTTLLPAEPEHVVIKKVLDEKDIFADVTEETTADPIVVVVDTETSAGVVIEEPQPTIVEVAAPLDVLEEKELVKDIETDVRPTSVNNLQEEIQESVTEHVPSENAKDTETQNEGEPLKNVLSREGKQLAIESIKNVEENLTESIAFENVDLVQTKEPDFGMDVTHDNEEGSSPDEEILIPQDVDESYFQTSLVSSTEPADTIASDDHNKEPTKDSSTSNAFHFFSTTEAAGRDIIAEIPNEDMDYTKTIKGSRSVNRALINDDAAATLFESYPPHDSDQTFNGNLADEASGIGKALPVTTNEGSNRSTIIIILSSGTACLFIVISVAFFLISFQRQHGTLDIEMQERSCGKDNLDEEDAETFAKLLEVELPPSVAIALEETEECL